MGNSEHTTSSQLTLTADTGDTLHRPNLPSLPTQVAHWPHLAPPHASQWINSMPKLLWTLQLRDPELTHTVRPNPQTRNPKPEIRNPEG